jgi:hypothetical protein
MRLAAAFGVDLDQRAAGILNGVPALNASTP